MPKLNKTAIEILNKMLFIIEFIFSLSSSIFAYKLFITKHYEGILNKWYLILFGISLIILLAIIIYSIINNKKKIEKLFVTIAIPIGIFYMIFMLPTYAPDESTHIWKAYEVSEGILFTKKDEEGNNYTEIPKELMNNKQEVLNKYNVLNQNIKQKTDYNDTTKIVSPAQNYPFFLYIPGAIGIAIGRILNINILLGIYLGKIFNYIIFLLAGYYIIKKLPFGKTVGFVYMLLPMILCQAISLSADSIINIIMLFYIVHILSLLYKEKISKTDKIMCIVLPILISVSKIAYLPLIGLNLLLIKKKSLTKKEKIVIIGVGSLISVIIAFLWFAYTMTFTAAPSTTAYLETANVNTMEQIKLIITKPVIYIKAMLNTALTYGQYYIDTFVGSQLGWLDISVDRWAINSFLILLLFSPFIEKNEQALNKKQRIWILLIAFITILLVVTGLYITWSPVGGNLTQGVQGRYFIPVFILILICLCMKENYIKIKNVNIWIPIILSALNIYVFSIIYKFFI